MKKAFFPLAIAFTCAVLLFVSCETPITVTTWKSPNTQSTISHIVIIPLFQKLENIRPFEQSMTTYFNSKGLKTIGSLDFLNPTIKYPIDDIKKKIDSIGADAVLIFIYKGTDKTQEYVPPTYYAGGWGGYWGGPYWGGGYYGGGVATGGYWTTTSVVNLKANLYTKESKDAIWTAEISVTDPKYVDQISTRISEDIYADWVQHGLIKLKK